MPESSIMLSIKVFLRKRDKSKKKMEIYSSIYCDMRLESWNLCIRRAELREACSGGNTNYTVSLGSDGAFRDISMVTTF
jgi:hypothetical protein